ncbi:MAG TPA: L,D-transpeptidase [Pseudonocardia sp.]|uniref:L,D-transpeptidase n=1 Tax=Pseudonocardia sp. TaxID=60912 RepID=UPI002B565B18|nr:L,D-transpeptidase [Pseudonocardia sp.]HTF46137.1 L,D-transpeptidase [Pseudonocardia sp.]
MANRRVAFVSSAVLGMSCIAGAAFAGTALADEAAAPAGPPCAASARSCVDLVGRQAWLMQNGQVIRGPVPISSGGDGAETPAGTFHVISKDKDHKSNEFMMPNGQPAPMPWSVFFEWGGIAFHSGDPQKASAGCIHLNPADAQAWFNNLQVGDEVEVHKADDSDDDNSADDESGDDSGDDSDDGGDSGDDGDSGDSGD